MDTLATRRLARRIARLALAIVLLGAPAARAEALRWSVDIAPDGEIFPVLDLSQATTAAKDAAGDGSGLVAVRATTDVPRDLRLTVETEGLAEPATVDARTLDRKSTRLNSSHMSISYAVFCLKKKKH